MADTEVARLEACLRRNAGDFLTARSAWLPPLAAALARLPGPPCSTFLFGGLLRDVLFHGPSADPRDVDLVVGGTTTDELAAALAPFIDRRTRFGGLQLVVSGVPIDIWPLEETWAFRRPGMPPASFAALPATTFLNLEGVALELLLPSGQVGRLYACGFFEGVLDRTLEINYEDNPSPVLCVTRSLTLATRLGYSIGPRLRRFLVAALERIPIEDLLAAQAADGGCVRCSLDVITSWRSALLSPNGSNTPVLPVSATCV